ncbi:MAG: 4-alpha-glucanotransferase [Anaerosolibacter sp.]|jgi:4-alpha-glucanotransferase|uniref:4-alpha-glucanotransferase n=1 Tax=Anaerosolibacter sp. TaxID=1872527 RepID=UPI00262C20CA|nr:4-alpha-glucanotransferase [Anaerosolibacter sp.]MDF2546363.1 4-alpha-glucanotransferase [Anaerosolibacter sp.]
MAERCSGILMHITSLPGDYGIGTLGKGAYEFVDFLVSAGQRVWQVLPLGPTGFGNSPYQSFSSFAGNPYLIDFEILLENGLLNEMDLKTIDFGSDPENVDYEKIYYNKLGLLKRIYNRSNNMKNDGMKEFRYQNKDWVEDYALFMALKAHFQMKPWQVWDQEIKQREGKTLKYYQNLLAEEIEYWVFLQYLFFEQWEKLKSYANGKGIQIIGDIPFYVAEDSVDAWANSEIVLLDEEKKPIAIAGCPPDFFSENGQLWGNPIYRWDVLEDRNYDWWIDRIRGSLKLYDIIRIDHFRGFESYWEIPYGSPTAATGRWVKGPGMKLFQTVTKELGVVQIIAEDLGFLTKEVIDFRRESKYPGMKVLQFAFDANIESDYLPHHHEKNCVVYTGTHDNDTIQGWLNTAKTEDLNYAKEYLRLIEEEGYHWGFIRAAWSSVAKLAIAPMQDFLGLDSMHRMNRPSTLDGNWQWRMKKEALTGALVKRIQHMTKLYGR